MFSDEDDVMLERRVLQKYATIFPFVIIILILGAVCVSAT